MLFAVAAFAAMLFKALIISAFYRAFVPLNFLVFEYLLTVTLYPILARLRCRLPVWKRYAPTTS